MSGDKKWYLGTDFGVSTYTDYAKKCGGWVVSNGDGEPDTKKKMSTSYVHEGCYDIKIAE